MGVPQGSILGSLLFLLYVNDFPQHVQNENCNIFADDTIIYSFGSNVHEVMIHLQGALHSAILWYNSNRHGINADKSAVMLVGKNSKVQNHVNVTINNAPVEQMNSMKYLGIHLDDNLSWDVQYDKLCRNIAGKINVLRRIRSFTKPGTLKLLYEKPCSLYLITHVLFGPIQSREIYRNYKELEIMQRESCREILIMWILGVWISYMPLNGLPFKRGVIISLHCSCTNRSMD